MKLTRVTKPVFPSRNAREIGAIQTKRRSVGDVAFYASRILCNNSPPGANTSVRSRLRASQDALAGAERRVTRVVCRFTWDVFDAPFVTPLTPVPFDATRVTRDSPGHDSCDVTRVSNRFN